MDLHKEETANLILQNVVGGNPLAAPSLVQGEPSLYPHPAPPTLLSSNPKGPLPLKDLLRSPGIAISVANYGLLAILDIAYAALNPLFLASPVMLGGLGLDPPTIGLLMGAWGLGNGIFQATCFTRVLDRFGPRRSFVMGIICFAPIFACFCGENMVAKLTRFGEEDVKNGSWIVWAILSVQIALVMLMDVSFGWYLLLGIDTHMLTTIFLGTIMIYIRAASPNKRSLGATNGIAQLVASIVRAIGPATATSLYAFSVGHDLLGGYAVYVILIALTILSVKIALMLPKDLGDDDD
jgi:MFS family permease